MSQPLSPRPGRDPSFPRVASFGDRRVRRRLPSDTEKAGGGRCKFSASPLQGASRAFSGGTPPGGRADTPPPDGRGASISASAGTTRPRRSRRAASSALAFGPPSVIRRSPHHASTGPSKRNSNSTDPPAACPHRRPARLVMLRGKQATVPEARGRAPPTPGSERTRAWAEGTGCPPGREGVRVPAGSGRASGRRDVRGRRAGAGTAGAGTVGGRGDGPCAGPAPQAGEGPGRGGGPDPAAGRRASGRRTGAAGGTGGQGRIRRGELPGMPPGACPATAFLPT